MFGMGWRANFEYKIDAKPYGVMLFDAAGRKIFYAGSAGFYNSPDGKGGTITKEVDGRYLWRDAQGTSYRFDTNGYILSITDVHGNQETFVSSEGKITSLIDRHGRLVTFDYQGGPYVKQLKGPSINNNPDVVYATYAYDNGNLTSVTFEDGKSLVYRYEDPSVPHHMTGNSVGGADELNFQQVFQYDNDGRVRAVSEGPGGRSYELEYGSVEVPVDPSRPEYGNKILNHTIVTEGTAQRTYYYENHGGADVVTKIEDGGCSCAAEKVYDSAFHVVQSKDNNGVITQKTYNIQGDLTSLIEAVGKPEQKNTEYEYTYSANGLVLQRIIREQSVASPDFDKITTEINDPVTGKLLTRREQGYNLDGNSLSPMTSYTYTTKGLYVIVGGAVKTIDGPRTDVSDIVTYEYYSAGDLWAGMLWKITEPNGAVTTFEEYDGLGNVLRKTDANNRDTTYTYNNRGLLETQTTDGSTTRYEYNALGDIAKVTYPKGNSVSYRHGASGLINVSVPVSSTASDSIVYAYTNGNMTSESVESVNGAALAQQKLTTYKYDVNNRLWRTYLADEELNNGNFEEFLYDGNGNLTHTKLYAAASPTVPFKTTIKVYDNINRLKNILVEQDPDYQVKYNYDAHGNLSIVTDPVSQATRYFYDDLGRQGRVESPETGTTKFEHDPAGNVIKRWDSRDNQNQPISYTYDGLNRLTDITYPDATVPVLYRYDNYLAGNYPDAVGRLTEVTDASGLRRFFYKAAGRLWKVVHTIDEREFTTEYGYDANGNLTTLTYPDGRKIQYEYDVFTDRVIKVTAIKNGITTVLAENITHKPFGPMAGLNFGNGAQFVRGYEELTYRLQSLAVTPTVLPARVYEYDAAGNIHGITRNLTEPHVFEYDLMNRLESWTQPMRTQSFTYDANGNRQAFSDTDGGQSTTYTYQLLKNLLAGSTGSDSRDYNHDLLGNITGWGTKSFVYDINGRMERAADDEVPAPYIAEYIYNIDGQRAKKTTGQATYFEYDAQGHLIHEYRPFENDHVDYVYLGGEPLAMLTDRNMNSFTVTPTLGANGTLTPSAPQPINYNQTTAFTVTPSLHYHIGTVVGCGGTLTLNASNNIYTYTTGPITADCTVTASFVIDTYTVTPTPGANGSLIPSAPQAVNYNETKAFTVTPSTGYHIGTVTGCGGVRNGSTYTTGPITADCTVTSSFVQGSWLGVFRNGAWYLDTNGNGVLNGETVDIKFAAFGFSTDKPVTGDWDGDGKTEIGVFVNGAWYLDTNGNGVWNGETVDIKFAAFGFSTDKPVTGDWDGDGKTEIGVFVNGAWYLDANRNGVWNGETVDIKYAAFGIPGDIPVTGDWDGDGKTEIGTYRNGAWYLDANRNGVWNGEIVDIKYAAFGIPGDIPVTGDWDGDGKTEIGTYRNGAWYLDVDGNGAWNAAIDSVFTFGVATDKPVVGKW